MSTSSNSDTDVSVASQPQSSLPDAQSAATLNATTNEPPVTIERGSVHHPNNNRLHRLLAESLLPQGTYQRNFELQSSAIQDLVQPDWDADGRSINVKLRPCSDGTEAKIDQVLDDLALRAEQLETDVEDKGSPKDLTQARELRERSLKISQALETVKKAHAQRRLPSAGIKGDLKHCYSEIGNWDLAITTRYDQWPHGQWTKRFNELLSETSVTEGQHAFIATSLANLRLAEKDEKDEAKARAG